MKKVPVPLLDLVQTVIKIKQISFPVNIFQLFFKHFFNCLKNIA